MENKVIDMTNRKGIKIIFNKREVEKYIDKNAILKIKRETKTSCASIDPIGLCTVLDCLACSNCDYKIIEKNGTILKDYQQDQEGSEKKYVIEFFDDLDHTDIEKYLKSEESNYRITRDSDRVILHYSKEDVIKRDEKMNQARKEVEAYYQKIEKQIETYQEEEKKQSSKESESPSLVKKIASKFKKHTNKKS